jgi:hypothetical protein
MFVLFEPLHIPKDAFFTYISHFLHNLFTSNLRIPNQHFSARLHNLKLCNNLFTPNEHVIGINKQDINSIKIEVIHLLTLQNSNK